MSAEADGQEVSENMQHMARIARAMLDDPGLDIPFDERSVVFEFEDDGFCSGNFGYAYPDGQEPDAFCLDGQSAPQAATGYWHFLKRDGDRGIARMLFQFNRDSRRVNAEFEYNDPARWKVTPRNLDTIVETLRPNLARRRMRQRMREP